MWTASSSKLLKELLSHWRLVLEGHCSYLEVSILVEADRASTPTTD